MARPFTAGLEYSMAMSVRPTSWLTLAAGLGAGSLSCAEAGADTSAAATASMLANETLFIAVTSSFLSGENEGRRHCTGVPGAATTCLQRNARRLQRTAADASSLLLPDAEAQHAP